MNRKAGIWIGLLLVANLAFGQYTRYIIKFRNKASNPFSLSNPGAYLSQRAIDRRIRYSIPFDSTDLPVTPNYIDSIRNSGAVTVLNISRWLNSVTIKTTDASALAKIKSFPFVLSSDSIAARMVSFSSAGKLGSIHSNSSEDKIEGADSYFNYGQSFDQVHIHNGEFLHDIGLRGQSMIIGMLDAGYQNYTSLHAFDSAIANGQVLGIYDFVDHDNSVVEDNAHGMECFSIIASDIPGQFIGTAPKADFYLFRTEDVNSEYPIEEHNWVCGAERIDSAGGDVITSSLGYNTFDNPAFNHTYADLNGHTTISAIGATLAARKGILVLIAAGNEGTTSWHYINTPADADSILAVGAVGTNGAVASFSGFGPSSDGRIKPDVASVGQGTVIETPSNTVSTGNGTSFACPNMAGLATCLWQGFQEFNNIAIVHALQQAGNIAGNPDNRTGYGIPDVKKAVLILLKSYATSSVTVSNCMPGLTWKSKDLSSMNYIIERKLPGENSYSKIAEAPGTGTAFNSHIYQYTDTPLIANAGVISYRISEVIDTSATGLSFDVITSTTVNLASSCLTTGIGNVNNSNEILVSPNPANEKIDIKFLNENVINKLIVRIINSIGQTVKTINTSKPQGLFYIPVFISNFPSGKYFISIYNNTNLLITKPFIKL